MSWRPKDWQNGWDSGREEDGMASKAEIFEAGADAMLSELREEPLDLQQLQIACEYIFDVSLTAKSILFRGIKGKIVFIPNEEV